jgi:hypothetical protein
LLYAHAVPGGAASVASSRSTYSASVRADSSSPMFTDESASPDVWFSSCRTVTPSGTFGSGTCSSRSSRPSSASVSTAAAVNDLLTDATRIGVSAVTGRPAES